MTIEVKKITGKEKKKRQEIYQKVIDDTFSENIQLPSDPIEALNSISELLNLFSLYVNKDLPRNKFFIEELKDSLNTYKKISRGHPVKFVIREINYMNFYKKINGKEPVRFSNNFNKEDPVKVVSKGIREWADEIQNRKDAQRKRIIQEKKATKDLVADFIKRKSVLHK